MLPIPIGETDNYSQLFHLSPGAQMRHTAIFGKSGTGKSTLIRNMIAWDIAYQSQGLALVDPHGDLVDDLLGIIPRSRTNDVIYFKPDDPERVAGINPLRQVPDNQKPLVVSSIISILKNIWKDFWGPQTEYILSNLVAALLEQKRPVTFLALLKALVDDDYREYLSRSVSDPTVAVFFQLYSEEWNDRFRTEASAPLMNKIGKLIGNPLLRAVIGQPTSSFDFRRAMDTRKILLCDLSKGVLGADVSSLLGSLIVSSISLAALSRKAVPEKQRVPFKLYADEVHNFIHGVDFPTLLSEARKYKLSVVAATQTISQLPEDSASALFGNCATLISFRVGGEDAEILNLEFAKTVSPSQLQELPDHRIYVRTLTALNKTSSATTPGSPQLVNTFPPLSGTGDENTPDRVIRTSRQRYGRPRARIQERHQAFFTRQRSAQPGQTSGCR
jgi:hypothetical protein